MPGHIGTSIAINTGAYFGRHPKELTAKDIHDMRARFSAMGVDMSAASDEDLRTMIVMRAEAFRDAAPTTAAQAATIILDGVRAGTWRILVGDDAHSLDERVRANPARAYERTFMDEVYESGHLHFTQG
jgi:hypothetical protein